MTRVDRLVHEAATLEPMERAELVERLLENVPVEMDEAVEQAWRTEVRGRLARIRSGEAKLIPWEETERRLLAR